MENMRLVLLVGQSNMAGRGVPEPEDLIPIPGVYALNEAMEFVPAIEPVTFDRPNLKGVSCGRTFAKLLYDLDPSTPVGLIPAAVGGTGTTAWKPGGQDTVSDKHPYDDALEMVKIARQHGEIVAILWHQGETDGKWKNENYAADLTEIINNFRRDLDLPETPFICGELGHYLKDTVYDFAPVNEGIRQVTSTLPHMGLVSAEGLTDKGDKLHFDTRSQHIFGERYFAEYCRVAGIK